MLFEKKLNNKIMYYNKQGTFLTVEEFKKIQKSFELKNEKKIQMKRM